MKKLTSSRSIAFLHVIRHLTIQISNSVIPCKYFIKLKLLLLITIIRRLHSLSIIFACFPHSGASMVDWFVVENVRNIKQKEIILHGCKFNILYTHISLHICTHLQCILIHIIYSTFPQITDLISCTYRKCMCTELFSLSPAHTVHILVFSKCCTLKQVTHFPYPCHQCELNFSTWSSLPSIYVTSVICIPAHRAHTPLATSPEISPLQHTVLNS